MKRSFVFLCGMLISLTGIAATVFPPQCKKVAFAKVSAQTVLLAKSATPRVYAITNVSKQSLWMNHTKADPGASAGFASQIQPGRWSALLIRQKAFEMDCHVVKSSGSLDIASCDQVLQVCQFQRLKVTKPGEFWVVENVPKAALMAHVD